MSTDLDRVTIHFSMANAFSVSTHGVERRDCAGVDRYVRVGPVVIGIPHGWRRVEALKQLASEKIRLIEELNLVRSSMSARN